MRRISNFMVARAALAVHFAIIITALASFTALSTLAGEAKPLEKLWEIKTRSAIPQSVVVDVRRPRIFYLAQKEQGLSVFKMSKGKTKPKVVAHIPRKKLAGLDAMNLVQSGSMLYVALGDLFAGGGSKAGLAIIDVSKPGKAKVVSVWSSKRKLGGSAVVAFQRGYAYLGAMKHGVFILDVRNPEKPRQVSLFQPDVNFPRKNPGRTRHPNARGLTVKGDRLYLTYDAGGLRIIDIADKTAPREIGRYVNTRIGKKPHAYNNVVVRRGLAYLAVDYCGLEIVDISNPSSIHQVGWWNPWRCESFGNIWFNSKGHINQIVLKAKSGRIIMSAGDSELQVVDVSNPKAPVLAGTFGAPRNGNAAWGIGVSGNVAILTYIKAFIPFKGRWWGLKAITLP